MVRAGDASRLRSGVGLGGAHAGSYLAFNLPSGLQFFLRGGGSSLKCSVAFKKYLFGVARCGGFILSPRNGGGVTRFHFSPIEERAASRCCLYSDDHSREDWHIIMKVGFRFSRG